jgi:hypothetical protein
MANTNVILTPGVLPQGYCFTSLQQYYTDIINITLAQLPGVFTTFNFGPNLPDPADQDKPWIRTNVDGSLDRVYTFSGLWLSPHAVPPSSQERRMWGGTEESLWAYDGGDGTDPTSSPPTETSGAMWKVDHDFDFRFPVGPGTNGSSYNSEAATILNLGDTGGEQKHYLLGGEQGVLYMAAFITTCPSEGGGVYPIAVFSLNNVSLTGSVGTAGTTVTGEAPMATAVTAHENMPPYKAIFFIRRTARKYYTVA